MFGFSNEVTYVITCMNVIGAMTTAGIMFWASRNAVAPLRPVYSAICALSTAFFLAHILLLFDIDNAGWIGYMHVLRAISWPLIISVPIIGYNYIRNKSDVIDRLSDSIEKRSLDER